MREIKFRQPIFDSKGKFKSYHYWGFLADGFEGPASYLSAKQNIDFKLIQEQYTGLKDKNGKEIYEGDIVKILYTDWMSKPQNDPRTIEQYMYDIAATGVIEFKDCEFGVKICSDLLDSIHCGRHGFIQVIGNIHENPELLNKD